MSSVEIVEIVETVDLFFGGLLRLAQPARGRGYRVNVDAFLLARCVIGAGADGKRVVDLGAGVGAVGLAIAALDSPSRVTLVERDEQACALLAKNARAFPSTEVRCGDVRDIAIAPVDIVAANPPFTPRSEGPEAPEHRRAAARSGELDPFLDAAARLLSPGGDAFFIIPAPALPRLFAGCEKVRLQVCALTFVHPSALRPARAVLVNLRSTPRPLTVEPPWFEWEAPGVADPAMAAFLRGESQTRA